MELKLFKRKGEDVYKYFPYKEPRKNQDRLIEDVHWFLNQEQKKVMLFQGECGLGKESALASQIALALEKKMFDKVVWLVPTDTGKINIEKELDAVKVSHLTLHNKSKLCSWVKDLQPTFEEEIDAYELCGSKMKNCPYYSNGKCPYLNQLENIEDAKIIICDYNYFLTGFIREKIFKKYFNGLKVLFLFNEVHILPDRCKQVASNELYITTISQAIDELKKFKPTETECINYLKKYLARMNKLLITKNAEIIKDKYLTESDVGKAEIPARLIVDETDANVAKKLQKLARDIIDAKISRKIGSQSKVKRFGNFIISADYASETSEKYESVLFYLGEYKTKTGEKIRNCIGFSSLDSYPVIKPVFKYMDKLICYSGTCYPERYVKLLRIYKMGEVFTPDAYMSPLLKNRTDIFYKDGLLTLNGRKNTDVLRKSADDLKVFLEKFEKPVAIISTIPLWKKIKPFLDRTNIFEAESLGQEEVKNWLEEASKKDIIQFSPFSMIAHSIDMSFLKTVILLGVPVRKQDLVARKEIDYLRSKLKEKGMEAFWTAIRLLLTLPACEKAVQSVMRGLRTEKDRLTVVWFDKRYVENAYHKFINSENVRLISNIEEVKTL
jgi:Rad3-related DNA helicase